MSNNRRVRFAEDSRKSPNQATLAAPQPARTLDSSSPPLHPDFVEARCEERAALEALRTKHLENASLAAQRAHDAMMLARSMQFDIRSSNAKLQKFKKSVENQGTPQPPSATQRTTSCKENHTFLNLDIKRENDLMSMPMAWIADVFLLVK
jgi:hypothetical protein